ncbi:unnamed protein product [Gongylonema pulchrum]|uniref:cardiolipin synthase (CMP-forming) n=1 Tax=Gongylonema pulchrum TaxID=637853 RepID=A0A183E173_9BILA|nr:unnamed protein product [Gongylonema pulchrum]
MVVQFQVSVAVAWYVPGDDHFVTRSIGSGGAGIRRAAAARQLLSHLQEVVCGRFGTDKSAEQYICPSISWTCHHFRIGLTPVTGYLVLNESYLFACAAFAVAGITDLLDGYIARNFRDQKSLLGSIIDPFADKLLIMTLFVTLTYVNLIPWPLTALVVLRDVLLIIGAALTRYRTMERPVTLFRFFNASISPLQVTPTVVSKLNTTLQMVIVSGSLLAPVIGFEGHPVLNTLYIATAVTTLYSGLQYARLSRIKPAKKN